MSRRLSGEHAGFCHYCGTRLREGERTWDHIIPRALGGQNALWNRVTACRACNGEKDDSWSTCLCPYCFEAKMRYRRQMRPKFRKYVEAGRIRDTWFEFLE